MKNKKTIIRVVAALMAVLMLLGMLAQVLAHSASWEDDIFAYGAGLSESQIESTRAFLGVPSLDTDKMVIKGEDAVKYLNEPSSDASMISSVYIKKNKTNNVNVEIMTPITIQSVSSLQYANAAITAGVNGFDIKVASVVPVSGTSALTGVYKALENIGVLLDTTRTQAANEEINLINDISESNKDIFSKEKLNNIIIEGKKNLVDIKDSKGVVVAEDVKNVVQNVLTNSNLNQVLNNVDIGSLNIIFNNFVNVINGDVNITEIKNQLNNLSSNAAELAKRELENAQQFLKTDEGAKFLETIKDKLNPEQLSALLEQGKNLLNSEQIENALNSIKDNLSPEKLNDLVNSAKGALGLTPENLENVKEQANSIFDHIKKFFIGIFDFVKGLFK